MNINSPKDIIEILQNNPSKAVIEQILCFEEENKNFLFQAATEIKTKYIKNLVYFRGLIEYSNICRKNCFYCGIRRENENVCRYTLTDDEVLEAARYAYKEGFGSIAIQGGELNSKAFCDKITSLLNKINKATDNRLGITLSLGEQTEEVLLEWKEAGARRYLLRIESSNRDLYAKIHPNDSVHSYDERLKTLKILRKLDYQVGTGVMIGLPFQTYENVAEDILFFKDNDIDMIGLGPYIEHADTPLFQYRDILPPLKERFDLTLKTIAILRVMQKDINMVASTAMQAIDKNGREKALMAGANIIMPNLTPTKYREDYLLYQNKPCIDEEADDCKNCLAARITLAGDKIAYNEYGDSPHYFQRVKKN